MLWTAIHTLGLTSPSLLQNPSVKILKNGILAFVFDKRLKILLLTILRISWQDLKGSQVFQRIKDSFLISCCELQYIQIRVGWWWVINTTLQNCGSNRWTSTHFSNSKDTCTKIQITFGRFQSSSNPWTSKDFRSVLKVYIRPLVLIVRHWKIFRSDIEREKVKYSFKRKPCNWESSKLSKFCL